jgi:DNA-binding MarR family transcriptional regulator
MSQIGALFSIHESAGGVRDIGEALDITSAAASQMLERLVQQGLIARSEDPHDRRVKQIALTEKGRQAMREIVHARQGWLDDMARLLSAAEKEQIIVALRILADKAGQLEQESRRER